MASQYDVTTWGKPSTFDFKTPSGQTCLMRRLDVEDLVDLDVLAEIDRLSTLVNVEHIQPTGDRRRVPQDRKPKKLTAAQEKAAQDDAFRKLTGNKEDFRVLAWMMDGVVAAAVLQPALTRSYTGDKTEHNKIAHEDRVDGLIYVDSVPFVDRMQIFTQAIGDMEGLSKFRDGSGEALGGLEAEPGDEMSPEPTADVDG